MSAEDENRRPVRRRLKRSVSSTLSIIVLVAFLLLGMMLGKSCSSGGVTTVDTTILRNSIINAKDLVTTYNYYSGVGEFENHHQIQEWDVPFSGKHLLYTFQGKALLGLDGDKISVSMKDDHTIVVDCPPISILSNEIDPASIKVYDESTNIFNPIRAEDVYSSLIEQKAEQEKAMLTNGVVEGAREYAKKSIRELVEYALSVLPGQEKKNYTIEVNLAENESLGTLDPTGSSQASSSSDTGAQTSQSSSSSNDVSAADSSAAASSVS